MVDATVETTAAPTFPGPTVARLTRVHGLLQQLRDGISDGADKAALRTTVDQIFPDIFAAITEIQTGPSLADQFATQTALDFQTRQTAADLAFAQQRDKMDAWAEETHVNMLQALFVPVGPGKV